MTVAYWCVFFILLFPYFFTVLAKSLPSFNNNDPRAYLAELSGWRKRANYIQLNSFEVNPAFGLAVIIAHLIQGNQNNINMIALVFVAARICYAICYLADKAGLRSLFWGIGMACIIGLFFA